MLFRVFTFVTLLPASLAARLHGERVHEVALREAGLGDPRPVTSGFKRCQRIKVVGTGIPFNVPLNSTGTVIQRSAVGGYVVHIDGTKDQLVILEDENAEPLGPPPRATKIETNTSGTTVMRFISDLNIKVSRQGTVHSSFEKRSFEFKPEHMHKEFTVGHVSKTCNGVDEPVFITYETDFCGVGLFTQPEMTCSAFDRAELYDEVQASLSPFMTKSFVSMRGFGLEFEFVSRPNPNPEPVDQKALAVAKTMASMAVLMGMIEDSDMEDFIQEQLNMDKVKPVEECFMTAATASLATIGQDCTSHRSCSLGEFCRRLGEDNAVVEGSFVKATNVVSHPDLNNKLGVVENWNESKGRWTVTFTTQDSQPVTHLMKHANLEKVPAFMMLKGLKSKPHWNGKAVELQGSNTQTGRWLAMLVDPPEDTEGDEFSVKPTSLEAFPENNDHDGICWPRKDCKNGMAVGSTKMDDACPVDLRAWSWERDTSVKPLDHTVKETLRELDFDPPTGTIEAEGKGTGFEAVSPVLSGEQGIASALEVVAGLKKMGIQAGPSSGLHVHVNAFGDAPGVKLTQRGVAGVWAAWAKYQLVIDEFLSAGRPGNHYASRLFLPKRCPDQLPSGRTCADMPCTCAKNFFKALHDHHATPFKSSEEFCNKVMTLPGERRSPCGDRYPHHRYFQVNLIPMSSSSHGTIEFRVHSATYHLSRIAVWVKFLLAFVERFGVDTAATDQFFRPNTTAEEDYHALRQAQASATIEQLREDLHDRWGPDNLEYLATRDWESEEPLCQAQMARGQPRICIEECEDEASRRALADWEQDTKHRMGRFGWAQIDKLKEGIMSDKRPRKPPQPL